MKCKRCGKRIKYNKFKTNKAGETYCLKCWNVKYKRKKRQPFTSIHQLTPKAQEQLKVYGINIDLEEQIKELQSDS